MKICLCLTKLIKIPLECFYSLKKKSKPLAKRYHEFPETDQIDFLIDHIYNTFLTGISDEFNVISQKIHVHASKLCAIDET